jgi:hypothetical protein
MAPEVPPKWPRHQTGTQRDVEGFAKKKERDSRTMPTVKAVDDEVTAKTDIGSIERKEGRRERDPLDRIDRLEDKHDRLDDKVDTISSKVDTMSGKLDVLPKLVDAVKTIAEQRASNEHVTFTAQVDVGKAKAKADIDVDKATRIERAKRITKLIVAGIGAAFSGGVIHWILGKL